MGYCAVLGLATRNRKRERHLQWLRLYEIQKKRGNHKEKSVFRPAIEKGKDSDSGKPFGRGMRFKWENCKNL